MFSLVHMSIKALFNKENLFVNFHNDLDLHRIRFREDLDTFQDFVETLPRSEHLWNVFHEAGNIITVISISSMTQLEGVNSS